MRPLGLGQPNESIVLEDKHQRRMHPSPSKQPTEPARRLTELAPTSNLKRALPSKTLPPAAAAAARFRQPGVRARIQYGWHEPIGRYGTVGACLGLQGLSIAWN